MKLALFPRLRKAATILSIGAVGTIGSIGLNGCGSGSSGSNEVQIAPETLEGVTLNLFRSFSVKFFKLSGEPGNEAGAGDFDGIADSFNLGLTDNGNTIAETIEVPSVITNLSYTYRKTSADTGRIVFNWFGIRTRSAAEQALIDETNYTGFQIFWESQTMTMDVLFADSNGVIRTTSSRVRGYQRRIVRHGVPPGSPMGTPRQLLVDFISDPPLEFDSTNAIFSVNGAPLPTNYQLNVSENTPSSIVWLNLQGRTIDFFGGPTPLTAAYQSTTGGLTELPGVDGIDDSGTMLVDAPTDGVIGGPGDFGWRRLGGPNAAFSIRYDVPVAGGGTTRKQINYRMNFETIDSGSWTDSDGNSGFFAEDLDTDNP